MYLITDNYGTRQRTWTKSEALAWLACCAPQAQVKNLWGRVVATRVQS
jgi:hypothetical protein